MKIILFNVLFANMLMLQAGKTQAALPETEKGDTVVVRLKNKNRVMIITERDKDLSSFRTIDLNKILVDIDSTLQRDSLSEISGQAMLKDSTLRIRRYSIQTGPRKSYNITIDTWSPDDTNRFYNRDSERRNRRHSRTFHSRIDDMFEIDLGWNNYLEKGALPSDNDKAYGLLPIWSNYVALRLQKKIYWQKSSNRWSNTIGIEVAWNNFKYDNDVIITKGAESVSWEPFPADQRMIKSKLTATWLNIPLMIHYKAQRSSFHVAVGGFAGYRLESHSKTKYEVDGDTKKDHVHTNFFLNSLQYGARVQLGFYGVDVFAQYNFNELFSKGKGPALTPFAFGFTL